MSAQVLRACPLVLCLAVRRLLGGVRLEAAGVRAAVRAGRVRASFHIYSTEHDVDLALDALTG